MAVEISTIASCETPNPTRHKRINLLLQPLDQQLVKHKHIMFFLVEFGGDTHIRDGVKDVITKLHSHGYVYSDIREVNIMACGPAGDSLLHVVLVDWDWAGVDGIVKYPISLNPNIPRYQDAKALCPIQKEHDMFIFDQLLI